MRYRLRFLLQEFDLPNGATIIGRSLDCNLTIEDPLVSRQHARIVIDEEGARVEDLKSRNGVRVNGVVVRQPTLLHDGDRVRVGTQDLVFCRVGAAGEVYAKTTGVLRLCANCRLPYPREVFSCPHCEATEQTDEGEGTLTGEEEHGVSWTVQLLVEALDRALALGRIPDAERIVRRATARLDEYLHSGGTLDAQMLGTVGSKVTVMTVATGDPTWALWVLDLYKRVTSVPALDVVERIGEAVAKCPGVIGGPAGALSRDLRTAIRTTTEKDVEALLRLERMGKLATVEERSVERVTSNGEWPV